MLQLGREYFDMKKHERDNNRQIWLLRISEYQQSGLTQDEWCSQNNISVSSLRYWLRRQRDEQNINATPEWLKVNVDNEHSVGQIVVSDPDTTKISADEISISYDGVTVKLPYNSGITGMQQIINILKMT